jgi:hypothetical protein
MVAGTTLLRSPSLGSHVSGVATNRVSHRTRRPPNVVSMVQRHNAKMPAHAGLREVHIPPVTPDVGLRSSRDQCLRISSSRRKKNAHFATRAMFEDFTEQALDVIAIAKEEMRVIASMNTNGHIVRLIVHAIVVVAVGYMLDEVNCLESLSMCSYAFILDCRKFVLHPRSTAGFVEPQMVKLLRPAAVEPIRHFLRLTGLILRN